MTRNTDPPPYGCCTTVRVRCSSAVVGGPGADDLVAVVSCPRDEWGDRVEQARAELGEVIVDLWRHDGMYGAAHETVALEPAQGQSEHSLADPVDVAAELTESLADLIAGKAVDIDGATVRLSPGVVVPPIIVGGMADAALTRAAAHADGWFALPVAPAQIAPRLERLSELAAEFGRPTPAITGSTLVAIDGDPTLPGIDELERKLSDPDGLYGIPIEAVPDMIVTGGPAAIAERIDGWRAIGGERVVVTLAAGNWFSQAELLAEATALLN